MAKKSSSQRWLREHFSDPYVKQAQQQGFRSRSAFKLMELQERDRLFKSGMTVIELGAAPGGWSQLLVKWVAPKGRVIALDILAMDPIPGVQIIQADFSNEENFAEFMQTVSDTPVDWVVSDMAPNMSGIDSVDQPRAMALAELALDFAVRILKNNGGFLTKIFQGEGSDDFIREVRKHFKKVVIRKPKASRSRSNEIYIIGKNN